MATDHRIMAEYLRTFSIFIVVDQPNNREQFKPP